MYSSQILFLKILFLEMLSLCIILPACWVTIAYWKMSSILSGIGYPVRNVQSSEGEGEEHPRHLVYQAHTVYSVKL